MKVKDRISLSWSLPGERWRGIPSLLNDFEASSLGRIRRVRGSTNSRGRCLTQREISNNPGYLVVGISHAATGTHDPRCVHRLVAEAWHGPPPDGHETNHINEDKSDNRPGNLEWVTRSANLRHSDNGVGAKNSQAIIDEETARQIRADHAGGLGYKRLAKKHGLSWGLVRGVASGKTWAHV